MGVAVWDAWYPRRVRKACYDRNRPAFEMRGAAQTRRRLGGLERPFANQPLRMRQTKARVAAKGLNETIGGLLCETICFAWVRVLHESTGKDGLSPPTSLK